MRAVHRLQQEAIEQLVIVHHTVFRDDFGADTLIELAAQFRGDRTEAFHHLAAAAAFFDDLREVVVLDDGAELAVLVIGEMAAGLVEHRFADVRREDLRVALLAQLLADEVLQFLAQHGTIRRPKDEALPHVFVDVEELQFAAQFAVVALFGLFELHEVCFEFFLAREGRAVEALELRLRLVAHVERRADRHQLHVLALRGVADVRSGAEVDEVAVSKRADLLAFGNLLQQVEFEGARIARALAEATEATTFRHRDGFLAGDALPVEFLVLLGDLFHLRLDLLKVVRCDAMVRQVKVVVEAVFHRRAVGELGIRPQAQDGGGHHVGTGVPQTVNIRHLGAFFEGLAFGGHGPRTWRKRGRVSSLKAARNGRQCVSA